jgi:hypothetical protein
VKELKYLAILGNVAFILWITYNGIDEGFKGTPAQMASYIGLITVLILDIFLLLRKNKVY